MLFDLHQERYIDEPFDVFYLEVWEIQNGDTASFRQKIACRKVKYTKYEKLPTHSRLVFRGNTLVDENVPAYWTGGNTESAYH